MTRRPLRDSDAAVSAVIGGIVMLAILSGALLYVNGYRVPEQGTALEVAARENAQDELAGLAARMGAAPAPILTTLSLRPERAAPPVLGGVVLTPVRAEGTLAFNASGASIQISHLTSAPAAGVAANDPIRVARAGAPGLMDVYVVGNRTSGRDVGALELAVGGAYLDSARYVVSGGAVIAKREDRSALLSPPGLQVWSSGTGATATTHVAWRLPVLSGASSETSGVESAQVALTPGPLGAAGEGAPVHETTIIVRTDALEAWRVALEDTLGALGTVTTLQDAPGVDRGTVTAVIAAPPGAPAGVAAVRTDYSSVLYEVAVN